MDTYKKLFRIAYDFMNRWQPCPENAEAWEAAAENIMEASEAGGNHPFLNDMLIAVYAELERQYKNPEKPNETQNNPKEATKCG